MDLEELLRVLHRDHGVSTVLVEAGPRLLGEFIKRGLVDEAIVHVAPIVIGDGDASSAAVGAEVGMVADATRFELWRTKQIGVDVELHFRRFTPPSRVEGVMAGEQCSGG